MADKKISALTSLTQGDVAASTDVLPIVDTSATETKKITASALVGAGMTAGVTNVDINSGSIDGTTIGANSAAAGTFTNLTASGTVSFSGATVSNGGAVTTIDINGGTIDATSIGASSASTGAFTTLTTSSTVTLNGGTANGVLYLNGSKVATSGSALTFNGTNLSVSGDGAFNTGASGGIISGTSTYSGYLSLLGGGSGATLLITPNTVSGANGVVYNTSFVSGGAGPHIFQVGGSEGFRLTSTSLYTASGINVGIGTSSPTQKLHVAGNALVTPSGGWTTGGVATQYFGDVYGSIKYDYNTTNFLISSYGLFSIATNGTTPTTRLTIDTSGNLGLGVTPSAWVSSVKAFDVGSNGASYYSGGITHNAYFDGTDSRWEYKNSSSTPATFLNIQGGGFAFNIAGNGTAGNLISFTQAMTLTAAGELCVGATAAAISNAMLTVYNPAATSAHIFLQNTTTGTGNNGGRLLMQGNDFYITNKENAPILFETNDTERARIEANGQFSAATALAGSNLVSFTNSSGTGYGISVSVNNDSSGTYRYFEGYSTSAAAQRIAIYTNGDVKNTNGVFAAFSDAKLKKDIVDAGSQWDDIKALRVRKYRLKDDATEALQIGLIAQEVEQVSPGLVNESQDETRDEDGNIVLTGEVTKGVKYSILYMKAVKALQEAITRIEQLEAKVAALESK